MPLVGACLSRGLQLAIRSGIKPLEGTRKASAVAARTVPLATPKMTLLSGTRLRRCSGAKETPKWNTDMAGTCLAVTSMTEIAALTACTASGLTQRVIRTSLALPMPHAVALLSRSRSLRGAIAAQRTTTEIVERIAVTAAAPGRPTRGLKILA